MMDLQQVGGVPTNSSSSSHKLLPFTYSFKIKNKSEILIHAEEIKKKL